MMWKESLVARFHHSRSWSLKAQGAPLIPRGGSRPFSTATLDPVPEVQQLDGDDEQEQPRDVPSSLSQVPETTNSPMSFTATANMDEKVPAKETSPGSLPVLPKSDAALAQASRDIEAIHSLGMRSIRSYLMEEIDTTRAIAPLSAYCFMTGFIDAVCFSAIYIWCAFQTGNTVQLSLAIARLFNGAHDYTFHIADQQALCSVLCFIFGAFIGRLGDKIGNKTRAWMTLGTFIQTLFTMSGAIVIWKSGSGSIANNRGDPAWTNALSFVTVGFISASMGLQGIMGKRLNTQFTTTVVLTTTWCELMTEPQLFNLRRLIATRDHKAIAILFLFLGGFTSRAVLDKLGSAGTLGVGTGFRFIITLWWLFAPAKKAKQ